MNLLYRWPLRHLVPLLLLALTTLFSVTSYWTASSEARQRVTNEQRLLLQRQLEQLQTAVEANVMRGDIGLIQRTVSIVAAYPNVERILVQNDSDVIFAASRFDWVGQARSQISPAVASDTLRAARQTMVGRIVQCSDGRKLCGYYPVAMGALGRDSLGLGRIGLIEIVIDLAQPWRDAESLVLKESLAVMLNFSAIAVVLWIFVRRVVTVRIGQLISTTQRLADGDLRARAGIEGNDELGHLARAVDGMAVRLSEEHDRLGQSEARLRLALQAASDAIWDWNIASGAVYYSPEFYAITGYPELDPLPHIDVTRRLVHPEDRERVMSALHDHLAGRQDTYQAEYRIVTPTDDIVWVLDRGSVVERDQTGNPIRAVGTWSNVTPRKLAEERLRLSQSVYESISEGIVITDRNNRIVDVNPAYLTITGFDRDDVIGNNPNVSSSGRHAPEFYRAMWTTLATTGHWEGEIWDRRKNGEAYPKWLSINTIQDEKGRPSYYVGIFTDITSKKALEQELEELAYYDALTRLPNRILFRDRLSRAIESAARHHTSAALMFIDLDRFKYVNDSLGHNVGDQLLIEVAQRIGLCVRKSDTVARLGGDEFTVILTEVVNADVVGTVATKIIDSLQQVFHLAGHEVFVGASIGIAMFPVDGQNADELLANADVAMYQAKERGRGNHVFFTKEMNLASTRRIELEREMRRGLAQGQFVPFYQAKVDLLTGQVVGMEALARWRHPEQGLISPAEFIPLAEDTGLIVELGEAILLQAATRTQQWREAGFDLTVAVNLSLRQFQQPGLFERILEILKATGLAPHALELEVTESSVMKDVAATVTILEGLKKIGVRLSVDDFGTGYSSLSYLKRLPLDSLKIDRAFVSDLPADPDDAAIVSAITSMADSLGLAVVAEGVETPSQLEFLRQRPCRYAQGYLFSKPLPEDAFSAYLSQQKTVAPFGGPQ